MKARRLFLLFAVVAACGLLRTTGFAQQTVAQQLGILDEKLNRLKADVEALQFNQEKFQKQIEELQGQVLNLRQAGTGASATELQALEARIKAVDEASQRRDQALIDQVAKELATLGSSRGSAGATMRAPTAGATEHVVQKGETLAEIAKQSGVSVADIVKANDLANPNEIKVGQKLTIPK
jgi:lysostaphin